MSCAVRKKKPLVIYSMDVPSHSPFGKIFSPFIREKCVSCKNLELTEKFILFDVLQNVFTDKVLDLIVMLAKFYIYKCKWQETAPKLKVFLRILRDRYTVERYLHITTNYMIVTYSGFPTRD